jgi:hypothetical protein
MKRGQHFQRLLRSGNCNYFIPKVIDRPTWRFIGKIRMRLAVSAAPAAVKRRVMDPVHTVKLFPVYSVSKRVINEYGASCGMRTGRRNRNTRRKLSKLPLCHSEIPQDLTWEADDQPPEIRYGPTPMTESSTYLVPSGSLFRCWNKTFCRWMGCVTIKLKSVADNGVAQIHIAATATRWESSIYELGTVWKWSWLRTTDPHRRPMFCMNKGTFRMHNSSMFDSAVRRCGCLIKYKSEKTRRKKRKRKRRVRKWITIFRRKRKGRRWSSRKGKRGRGLKYVCYFKGYFQMWSVV